MTTTEYTTNGHATTATADSELGALLTVVASLEGLAADQLARVLVFINSRFGSEETQPTGKGRGRR